MPWAEVKLAHGNYFYYFKRSEMVYVTVITLGLNSNLVVTYKSGIIRDEIVNIYCTYMLLFNLKFLLFVETISFYFIIIRNRKGRKRNEMLTC